MLFFRVILCVMGLLLYLVIREFSDRPVPAGRNVLQQGPVPAVVEATPPAALPWDSPNIGTFQPVAAKPAVP